MVHFRYAKSVPLLNHLFTIRKEDAVNNEKKVAFRLSSKLLEDVEKLKKKSYFNKNYSDLYRDAMEAGLKVLSQQKKGE